MSSARLLLLLCPNKVFVLAVRRARNAECTTTIEAPVCESFLGRHPPVRLSVFFHRLAHLVQA
jgi:hypothetical protein